MSDSQAKNAPTAENGAPSFTILHADHDIDERQMQFIEMWCRWFAPPHFFILEVELPEELGSVPNALHGPACGDDPVPESEVFYSNRGLDREWEDRLVRRPKRPTQVVQVIGTREEDVNSSGNACGDITVFTAYGGPLAPQNPDDPGCQDPEASREFWAKHALAAD